MSLTGSSDSQLSTSRFRTYSIMYMYVCVTVTASSGILDGMGWDGYELYPLV